MFLFKKLCMNGHFRNPKLLSKKTKTKTNKKKKEIRKEKNEHKKRKKKHGTTNDTS